MTEECPVAGGSDVEKKHPGGGSQPGEAEPRPEAAGPGITRKEDCLSEAELQATRGGRFDPAEIEPLKSLHGKDAKTSVD